MRYDISYFIGDIETPEEIFREKHKNMPNNLIFDINDFLMSINENIKDNITKTKTYKRFINNLKINHKIIVEKIDREWEEQVNKTLGNTIIKILDLDNFI